MKKISARQLYFFLACVAPVGKLVAMPSQLAAAAGNDLLFPAFCQYVLQSLAVCAVLWLATKERTLGELLENTFGKVVSKILLTLLSGFFLFAALFPLLEQKLFVQSAFYDTLPSLAGFAPFFLFSAYLCAKPLSSFGRAWDILGPIAIAGFFGVILLSAGEADYAALLPLGAHGAKGFWAGLSQICAWFFDAALLLPLIGNIQPERGMIWKGTLFYALGGCAVLFFLAVFFGIFQETAAGQLFAFSKTSKYFSGITVLGRIDYLFIYALALVMAFYVAMPLQACVELAVQAYGNRRVLAPVLSVVLNGLFLLLLLLIDYRAGEVGDTVTKTLFFLFPAFALAVPALCLPLRRDRRERA